jgi:hypothetical protein
MKREPTRVSGNIVKDPETFVSNLKTKAKELFEQRMRRDGQTADEMYGFTYVCQHGPDYDPSCQEELSDEAQAELLKGNLPTDGRVRMCSACAEAWQRAAK